FFIWRAKNLNRSSSSSGVPSEHWTGANEDGMGGAAGSLGGGAVADEDAGLLAAALPSAGRETTAPDVTAWETPPRQLKGMERLHAGVFCGGRKTWASRSICSSNRGQGRTSRS
ncbi:hypothetical protein ILYODFUR_010230, partial [Ilyodon furcidens]